MDVRQLPKNSLQKISVYNTEFQGLIRRKVLDSLFLSVHSHSETSGDCADFLVKESVGEIKDVFRVYSPRPEGLEFRDGIWILPLVCELGAESYSSWSTYPKYEKIAKDGGLIR